MHYFVTEMSKMELGATRSFAQRAQSIYDENLEAYIKLLFRRSMAKLIVSSSNVISSQFEFANILYRTSSRQWNA